MHVYIKCQTSRMETSYWLSKESPDFTMRIWTKRTKLGSTRCKYLAVVFLMFTLSMINLFLWKFVDQLAVNTIVRSGEHYLKLLSENWHLPVSTTLIGPKSFCLSSQTTERCKRINIGLNRTENPLHPIVWFPSGLNIDDKEKGKILRLLPENFRHMEYDEDRVYVQLEHVPSTYKTDAETDNPEDVKVVYIWHKEIWKNVSEGREFFKNCKVNRCSLTHNRSSEATADAIVFANSGHLPESPPFQKSSPKQIAILNINESPDRSWSMEKYKNFFNWTMTYRMDSTIPDPYFKIGYECNNPPVIPKPGRNFAEGRTKTVAWMVSNCYFVKSGRMQYAKELSKYITVDIYGNCGSLSCPTSRHRECIEMIKRNYKFYLAFENHKCEDYMTEKVKNAYDADLIPIVLGARKEDYAQVLPKHSYIHVEDFESPKKLAEYLIELDKNDTLYNEYFKWKETGMKLVDDDNWCRVCALLHETSFPVMWYEDIQQWWKPKGICNGKANWK